MRGLIRSSAIVVAAATVLATFGGSSAIAADSGQPVINEFSASTVGTDVEYLEVLAAPGTDLSSYRILSVEGDSPVFGVVDRVEAIPAAGPDGRSLITLPSNALENGTMSLLLVSGTIPAAGSDIDANDDGVLDAADLTVIDAVAVNDGGSGDLTYGGTILGVSYDGLSFAPGGASRIAAGGAEGQDTDEASDWVRNDFDLAGIPTFTGTLVAGESVNTPGVVNVRTAIVTPPTGEADCDVTPVTIGSVQGSGEVSPVSGQNVLVKGIVTGDFQVGGFDGYFVQDAGDGDTATSDGIFVYAPGARAVSAGDVVSVSGLISEFDGLTQVTAGAVEICEPAAELPAATPLTLPAAAGVYESLEGMRVTMPQQLTVLEFFEFGRYGTIDVGLGRQQNPTAVFVPGSPEATALTAANLAERITIDDGRSTQNPDPAIHPNGEAFTLENTFRGGDQLTGVTGILDSHFGTWAIQPTQGATRTAANPRADAPAVGGDVRVASFNVLNYFTTLNSRGAVTPEEFERQEAKIVSALAEIDADVFGLIEIENNGTAVAALAAALNEHLGADVYSFIDTGVIGGDVITTALLYKSATVEPRGAFELLSQEDDARFLDAFNRPALTQTFGKAGGGDAVTVVVNHLKSKGSDCLDVGDPDAGDGQGNCNGVRTDAAAAMADWLATDPTGQGAGRELIIGDLNSYAQEDPIRALTGAGYTDLQAEFQQNPYTYVFDGLTGYLDYALAGSALLDDVTGASAWNINADEPSLLDYTMAFKQPAQDALFAPDPYRSSDHDPVVVGLSLAATQPVDTTPPTLSVVTSTATIPQGLLPRLVRVSAAATDDSGQVDVALTSVTSSGRYAYAARITNEWFVVTAPKGAVYTFTYTATDAAGNATSASGTVKVGAKKWW